MITTAAEGRTWDGLSKGQCIGVVIPSDGWEIPPEAGDVARFWTGDVRTIVAVTIFSEGTVLLHLDQDVAVPDNCGIWMADGL